MKITCNKLPEKKPELTTEQRLNRLEMMYHLGKAAAEADPVGMDLVQQLMLGFTLSPEKRNELRDKIRKHFGIPTINPVDELRRRQESSKKWQAQQRHYELVNRVSKAFYDIGYRQVANRGGQNLVPKGGCRFSSTVGYGKDLVFDTWKDAEAWLIKAECLKKK